MKLTRERIETIRTWLKSCETGLVDSNVDALCDTALLALDHAAEVSALREQLEQTRAQLENKEAERVMAAVCAERMQTERNDLRAQLEAAKAELETVRAESVEAHDANTALRSELADLKYFYLSRVEGEPRAIVPTSFKGNVQTVEAQLTAQPDVLRDIAALPVDSDSSAKAVSLAKVALGLPLPTYKSVAEMERALTAQPDGVRALAQAFLEEVDDETQLASLTPDQAAFEQAVAFAKSIFKPGQATPAASTQPEGKVREAREFLEIARESLEPYADPEFIRGLSQSTAESRSFLAKVGLKQIDAQLQALAAPAPAPRQVTHVCEGCDMEWHTGKAVTEGHTCKKAPAPACKNPRCEDGRIYEMRHTCWGSTRDYFKPWKPCPDCNAGEGEKP